MSISHERINVVPIQQDTGVEVGSTRRLLGYRRELIEESKQNGVFDTLTPKQKEIIEIRGYLGEGPLYVFKKFGDPKLEELNITYSAAMDREIRAFRVLEAKRNKKGGERLKMTQDEQGFLLRNPSLPVTWVAEQLGHSERTIAGWRESLGIASRPVGRPRVDKPNISKRPRGRPRK